MVATTHPQATDGLAERRAIQHESGLPVSAPAASLRCAWLRCKSYSPCHLATV
jgi:hypothetical protein